MPRPIDPNRLGTSRPRAAHDRFTNRVDETRRFLELLNAPQGAPLPLLMFYGVGGAGKSSLLDHLQQECERYRVPWAAVNLAETPAFEQALPKLASDLGVRYGWKLPQFERTRLVLGAKEAGEINEGEVAQKGLEFMLKEVPGLVKEVVGFTPLAAFMPFVKLGGRLLGPAFDRAMENPSFRETVIRLGGQKELIRLLQLSAEQLRLELARAFAADLIAALPERQGPVCKGVLFLDTHESLWRDGQGGAHSQDGWIRHLRQLLHDQGVLLTMAGRDSLNWPEDWNETDSSGRRVWLEEHRMGGLTRRDATEFLRLADGGDLTMPPELQEAILQASNETPHHDGSSAHHCYLLSLAAEIVANTKASEGRYPAPEELRVSGDAGSALVARFLTSLHSQAMVEWLTELALSPCFDQAYALALDAERQHHNGRAGWNRLSQLSLVTERDDGLLQLHKLLRAKLREQSSVGQAALVHQFAYGFWQHRQPSLAWYHRRFLDHKSALAEFEAEREEAQRRAQVGRYRELLEWWSEVELEPPQTPQAAEDWRVYGRAVQWFPAGNRAANHTRAIECFRQALSFFNQAEHPQGWALTQHNLGWALCELSTGDRASNTNTAIQCFEAALKVRTLEAHPHDWALTQTNLGIAYRMLPGRQQANLERATQCYQNALRVHTRSGYPDFWGRIYINLGNAHLDMPGEREANLDRAIACYEHALEVFGEEAFPFQWALAHNNLGEAYAERLAGGRAENLGQALLCYQDSLRVYTEADYPYEWARGQYNLGQVYAGLADLVPSEQAYQEALEVYSEADYPEEWAKVWQGLGGVYEQLGRPAEACTAFAQAARGYRTVGMESEAAQCAAKAAQ
jgi:tetratricopeptide (TPR) repeat protein